MSVDILTVCPQSLIDLDEVSFPSNGIDRRSSEPFWEKLRQRLSLTKEKDIHFQSKFNKQGRDDTEVPAELKQKVVNYFKEISEKTFNIYDELNEAGIARELARGILPVNLYTEWYWKNDLHNIFHFLKLRMDEHAQYEIRVFANAMAEFVKQVVPIAYEAFEDYILNGIYFSNLEKDLLTTRLPKRILDDLKDEVIYKIVASLNDQNERQGDDLYKLYQKNGGIDCADDFAIKWKTMKPETGNIFEMREFLQKLEKLTTQ